MAQRMESTIEVAAPVEEVYGYWANLENLSTFMNNVQEVRSTGPDTTHWKVSGPMDKTVEFDARTTQNEPNEAIAWNSTGGQVGTSGQVRFVSLSPDRTRVEVQMNYSDPPAGKLGEVVSQITGGPKTILEQDLRNFRDIMEGSATPEEIQQRVSGAKAHTSAVAFLTSGTGLAVLGAGAVLYLLLRRRNSGPKTTFDSGEKGRVRFIVEI